MRFRRKTSGSEPSAAETAAGDPTDAADPDPAAPALPRDSAEVGQDDTDWIDLGSLRIPPRSDREVRLQVDEASGEVQAVLVVGADGALEVRAFAASRHGDLWTEVRPQIAEETGRAGGTAEEREGRFGTELFCQRPATGPDGQAAVQPSRVVGVNGDRWLLRATFVGRPAMEPEDVPEWDETLAGLVVHRGSEAMRPGEALPLELPERARRVR